MYLGIKLSVSAQLRGGTAAFTPASLFALNEPGVWYDPSDLTTLFQDTAGTTPVTTPGQSVALALDKSKGLTLGPELVTNGDFNSSAGWTLTPEVVISGGVATFTSSSSSSSLFRSASVVVGRTYEVTVVVSSVSAGTLRPRLFGGLTAPLVISSAGTYTFKDVVTTANSNVGFVTTGPFTGIVDNISVKELPGFHATQATLASRPTYGIVPLGGRRNLLTRTEEFGDAVWGLKTNITVTANQAVAPDNQTTADKVQATGTGGSFRATFSAVSGVTYTYSVYAKKADTGSTIRFDLRDGPNNWAYTFNLDTLAVTRLAATATNAVIVGAGNGWYRCVITATATSTSGETYVYVPTSGDSFLIWGAQLETGSSATAYQRVGSAFDVTEAGVASLSYLSFDGIDDFMITPTITPGIDKAQVFAGVRKLSDAASSLLVETSTTSTTTANTIGLLNSTSTGGQNRFNSAGSVRADAFATLAAPVTLVYTGLSDVAAPSVDLRINGVSGGASTISQGTVGNYAAHPIYIGRRAGTSAAFNGNLFSLIVRFGTNLDAGTITNTETWVNSKTGAYT